MLIDDQSQFICADCGERASTLAVDYDSLGYAVCPACEASTRPLLTA